MSSVDARKQVRVELDALEGETEPEIVPEAWVADAPAAPLNSGEARYYATLYTVERELAEADVLAGRRDGRGESWRVHVLYARRDASRRVQRTYPVRVVETASGVAVEPQRFMASIAVDGRVVTPQVAPRAEMVVDALDALHDITVSEEGGDDSE